MNPSKEPTREALGANSGIGFDQAIRSAVRHSAEVWVPLGDALGQGWHRRAACNLAAVCLHFLAAADQHWVILGTGAFDFWPNKSFQPIQCPYVFFWLGLLATNRRANLKLLGATRLAGQDLLGAPELGLLRGPPLQEFSGGRHSFLMPDSMGQGPHNNWEPQATSTPRGHLPAEGYQVPEV